MKFYAVYPFFPAMVYLFIKLINYSASRGVRDMPAIRSKATATYAGDISIP